VLPPHAHGGAKVRAGIWQHISEQVALALLDLLATQDVAGVDAAMEAFIDVYVSWVEQYAAQA